MAKAMLRTNHNPVQYLAMGAAAFLAGGKSNSFADYVEQVPKNQATG
jgi:hypothetical protein